LREKSSFNFDAKIFNQRIAQKFVASGIEHLARGFLIRAVELDFEKFTNVNGFNAGVAHVFEGFQNRDALRVNDGFLWGDDDFCFHASRRMNLPELGAAGEIILKT
jgi:hypothetical protein